MALVKARDLGADGCADCVDVDAVVAHQNRIRLALYLVSHPRMVWGGNHR